MKIVKLCFALIPFLSLGGCKKKSVTELENEMIEGIKKGAITVDKPITVDPEHVEALNKQIEAGMQEALKVKDNPDK